MPGHDWLTHPLLDACGVEHGFGLRDSTLPPDLLRPRQVHGSDVASVIADRRLEPEEADAVVSKRPGVGVAIVTADCVPVLAATSCGSAVAAIHAGWRGLAAGVVERGLLRLREAAPGQAISAVIGPRIGPCCYEVDAPVLTALDNRFGAGLAPAIAPARAGHQWLDLARLVEIDLRSAGVLPERSAVLPHACTSCNPALYHSHRRDGGQAGRMVHHIAAGATQRASQGVA